MLVRNIDLKSNEGQRQFCDKLAAAWRGCRSLILIPLLDSLIERLQDSGIHGGDHIDGGIQLFFGHARFPCVRKAPLHSRIAEPHHRDSKTHQHLLALAQAFHCMGVAVKGSKVGFLRGHRSRSLSPASWTREKPNSMPEAARDRAREIPRAPPRNRDFHRTSRIPAL